MRSVTSVEAQNRFGELIDAAQREPVSITRRGRTVAFVVSPADLEELIDARRGRAAAVEAYDEYLGRVAGRLSHCLISIDADLLGVHPFVGVEVLTPGAFVARFER
jgi:antitoxin Phd